MPLTECKFNLTFPTSHTFADKSMTTRTQAAYRSRLNFERVNPFAAHNIQHGYNLHTYKLWHRRAACKDVVIGTSYTKLPNYFHHYRFPQNRQVAGSERHNKLTLTMVIPPTVCNYVLRYVVCRNPRSFLPRDALVHSAVLRLHVVRLSVCLSVCL